MAKTRKKFFNEKVNSTRKTMLQIIIIAICIVGIILLLILIAKFNSENQPKINIKLKDNIEVEVNSRLPEKEVFFQEIDEEIDTEEIEISYKKVDITKTGTYEVTIKVNGKNYKTNLHVVDTTAPLLELKDVTIDHEYSANDFVESCVDNSLSDCNIKFFEGSPNQDGQKIDYASYNKKGTYTIKIEATDNDNNSTVKEVNLIITNDFGEVEENPSESDNKVDTTCKFGSNEYDSEEFILASDISINGCAVDINSYDNEELLKKSINSLMETETARVRKEFSKIDIDGNLSLQRDIEAITNYDGKGIVGYTLHFELSVTKDNVTEVIESYFVDKDGNRIFTKNKYDLK